GSCGECSATNVSLCEVPEPLCNTSVGECVPCYVDVNGTSVGCESAEEGGVCISSTAGAAHCGCESDADCGALYSGRVCDPSTSMCIEGCRGEGGNRCPQAEQCTSQDTSIGACSTPGNTPGSTQPVPMPLETSEVSHDGGCACSLPSSGQPAGAAGWLALVAAGLVAARRRDRTR
ncbi:MAG: hypothetical protein CVU63_15745, partial [Deltaproteobacteria bacterium HGW-Deltaproteobacteria-20]